MQHGPQLIQVISLKQLVQGRLDLVSPFIHGGFFWARAACNKYQQNQSWNASFTFFYHLLSRKSLISAHQTGRGREERCWWCPGKALHKSQIRAKYRFKAAKTYSSMEMYTCRRKNTSGTIWLRLVKVFNINIIDEFYWFHLTSMLAPCSLALWPPHSPIISLTSERTPSISKRCDQPR